MKQLEFLNRNKEKFDWDNEELDFSEANVLPEMAMPHHDVLVEMPGVRLESDFVSDTPAVEQPPAPTYALHAVHVLRVSGLAGTTGVLPEPCQTTGVLDLSKDSDDSEDEGEVASQLFKQEDRNENDSDSDGHSDDESDGDPDDQASEGQERVMLKLPYQPKRGKVR